jgi:hypothetical protein
MNTYQNGIWVEGILERWNGEIWEAIYSSEPILVREIGEVSERVYALLDGSEVPVRWVTGAGAFGTKITTVEVMAGLL